MMIPGSQMEQFLSAKKTWPVVAIAHVTLSLGLPFEKRPLLTSKNQIAFIIQR